MPASILAFNGRAASITGALLAAQRTPATIAPGPPALQILIPPV